MTSRLDQKYAQLRDLARLVRAQRSLPLNRDLAAVVTSLESAIGPTISQRLAARVLGVSHVALSRWVRAGDLPLVINNKGREEFPTRLLVDLAIAVGDARDSNPRAHVLEPIMHMHRRRADSLRRRGLAAPSSPGSDPHDRAKAISLAYHGEIARNLTRGDADEALRNVWRLSGSGKMNERYAEKWEQLLGGSLIEIKSVLIERSSEADDLRQNSPFTGMLSEPERQAIVELAAA
ncbi:MAG: hypothetical protein QM648_05885 [Solirubrobacterales bacterium]